MFVAKITDLGDPPDSVIIAPHFSPWKLNSRGKVLSV